MPREQKAKLNVKIKCALTFLLVVFAVNMYIYMNDGLPLVKERCFEDYADYSVILDLPIVLSDGSIQDADGTLFPSNTVWEADGLTYGCLCALKPCIKRCCPKDQSMNNNSCFNTECIHDSPLFLEVSSIKNHSQQIIVPENHFYLIDGICSTISDYEDFVLSESGDVMNKKGIVINYEEFCIGFEDGPSHKMTVVACWDNYFTRQTTFTRFRDTWRYGTLVVAMVLLLVTLVVFIKVPRLQQGYGKSLMGYMFAQVLRKAATIWFKTYLPEEADLISGLKMTNIPETFADLSSHLWQVFIAYQIWTVFRHRRVKGRESVPKKPNILYGTFAFGLPVVLMVVWLMSDGSLQPNWENYDGQRFRTLVIIFSCTFVLLAMELASMALCIAALCHLRGGFKLRESFQGSNSRCHSTNDVQWSSVFTKLTLITGLDYVLGNTFQLLAYLFFFTKGFSVLFEILSPVFNVINDLNNLRGVEIFFIFVFKKDVWESLGGKNFSRKRLLSKLFGKTR